MNLKQRCALNLLEPIKKGKKWLIIHASAKWRELVHFRDFFEPQEMNDAVKLKYFCTLHI